MDLISKYKINNTSWFNRNFLKIDLYMTEASTLDTTDVLRLILKPFTDRDLLETEVFWPIICPIFCKLDLVNPLAKLPASLFLMVYWK